MTPRPDIRYTTCDFADTSPNSDHRSMLPCQRNHFAIPDDVAWFNCAEPVPVMGSVCAVDVYGVIPADLRLRAAVHRS